MKLVSRYWTHSIDHVHSLVDSEGVIQPWTGAEVWRRAALTGWGWGEERVSWEWCPTPSVTFPCWQRADPQLVEAGLALAAPARRSSCPLLGQPHPRHNSPRPRGQHPEAEQQCQHTLQYRFRTLVWHPIRWTQTFNGNVLHYFKISTC